MRATIKENKMVSTYLLLFLIHGSQTGIGALNYQSEIVKGAGYDSWVSILVMGLSLHLLFFMILHIIKNSSRGDLISFHTDLFGKVVGGLLNLLIAAYFLSIGLLIVDSYIDVLQIWVFDGIAAWEFALILCVLIYYLVSGGFRIIVGTAFLGVIIPSGLLLALGYLFTYAEPSYLTPVFNHSLKEYFISAKASSFMFFGFETALIYFPFIKNGMKSSKWGHYGLAYTTVLYLAMTVLTFMFFTQGKLHYISWPTLTMIKVISFPFIERFEFIFIFTWLLVVMPVICIYLWSTIRIVKLTFPRVKATKALFMMLVCWFIVSGFLIDMSFTQLFDEVVTMSGNIFIFGYIPLLFLISLIKSKIKKRKPQQQGNQAVETKA